MSSSAITRVPRVQRQSIFRRHLVRALSQLETGRIELNDQGSSEIYGAEARTDEPTIRVHVHDQKFYERLALSGTLGAGESYIEGEWSTDDLTALIRVVLRNSDALAKLESGISRVGLALARGWALLRPNTRLGSKRNIAAHYDLGNVFFQRMLDPTLCYSSGVFESESSTLEQASHHKLELLFRQLELSDQDRLLEIGTGWGQLALSAAGKHGAHVTSTTISREQHRLATQRVKEQGLQDRVRILEQDYRDLSGQFSKLVSVEMIEAIGDGQYETFFRKCDELLEPGGLLSLQSITIADQIYDRHKDEIDFIKRYIFPGSTIPSVLALVRAATGASTLQIRSVDDYGPHYARTLAEWRANLLPHKSWVIAHYGERFWRMWMFYLAYCEAGFSEGYLSVKQFLFAKPRVHFR